MGGRAKVPMFTWSTFVRSGATLNLDRPAENEARASNKTLGAPLWTQHGHMHLIHCRMVGEWLIRRAGTHVVRCRRWSVVQFWRAGSSSQQTLKAPFLGVQWLQVLLMLGFIIHSRYNSNFDPVQNIHNTNSSQFNDWGAVVITVLNTCCPLRIFTHTHVQQEKTQVTRLA